MLNGGLSVAELAVLAVLVLVVLVAAWRMFVHFTGRDTSDVSGLHFTQRGTTKVD